MLQNKEGLKEKQATETKSVGANGFNEEERRGDGLGIIPFFFPAVQRFAAGPGKLQGLRQTLWMPRPNRDLSRNDRRRPESAGRRRGTDQIGFGRVAPSICLNLVGSYPSLPADVAVGREEQAGGQSRE